MTLARHAFVASLLSIGSLVAACSALHGKTDPLQPQVKAPAGQVAALRAIGGSAVSGKVIVSDRGDGAIVLLAAMNVPRGEFRIAFHENPNCSSPNGFSAGPAWAPGGKRPQDLVPAQRVNSEDRVEAEVRVAGLHSTGASGVAGRSVVIYSGANVTEARPDVPNERVACGVFEPVTPLF
jgi:Cu/Zn superoxide dismutase